MGTMFNATTVILLAVAFGSGCCCNDQQTSKTLDQSLRESDLVMAGYTRAVFKMENESKVEFLVFNTYKGETLFPLLLREREPSPLESALSRRLVNVSGFGCGSEVRVGETYVLFLNVVSRVARHGGGPLLVYSREKEDAIQEAIGSLGSWSEWSSCSKSCGSGRQFRRRNCGAKDGRRKCSSEDGQERTCNTFPCTGLFDVLKAVGLPARGVAINNRSSHEVSKDKTWRSQSLNSLHRAFPMEFGLMVTLNAVSPGYIFKIMLSDKVQFGMFLGESNVTVLLSDVARAQFNVSSPWGGDWHCIAFSFRRSVVTFFHNCKPVKSLTVNVRLRPVASQTAYTMLGGFQGYIEQLVISEAPSAAAEQCSPTVQPMMHLDSPSRNDLGVSELKSKTDRKMFRGDMLPKRDEEDEEEEEEDEDEDDGDFAFGEQGSGLRDASKVIPLISDDDEHYADGPDEDDDEEESDPLDNWDELLDDEVRPNDPIDNFEGSGSQSQEMLSWSDWSPCSHTCGWGTRTRTPYCADNAADLDACSVAVSSQRQTETCFVGLCPTTTTTAAPTSAQLTFTERTTAPLPTTTALKSKSSRCTLQCENGGICNPYRNKCHCLPGYYGRLCEYAICKPACQNRGACVAPNKCHCKNGYSGKACQRAICQEGCQNGGQCIAPGRCACPSGYTGQRCESPRCNPPCYNGGYCVKPYSCHCPPMTTGAFCEKFMCFPECLNGGVCSQMGKCVCPQGFKGRYCEKAYCKGGCENGGICGKNGKCICLAGFYGMRCEKRKCTFRAVNEPYKRSYKQKVVTEVKIPCGAWGWKQCIKMKTHYVTVFKTFYRTVYKCNPVIQTKPTNGHKAFNGRG